MSPSRPFGSHLRGIHPRHPLLAKKRLLTGVLVALALMLVFWLTSCATPDHHQRDAPRTMRPFLYSPYLYVTLPPQMETPTFMGGVLQPVKSLFGLPGGDFPSGVPTLTLAFATGECGHERWDDLSASQMVDTQLKKLLKAKIDYVISTGGANGVFICSSEQEMEAFIARYESPQLLGFDFDIEAGQSEEVIHNLVEQIHRAAQRRPHLRMSFTLAAASGTEPGRTTLNPEGAAVMKSIQRVGLKPYFINLMVMNFGEAKPGNCVVEGDRCDMAASAMATVRHFAQEYGVPLQQIEITPMIGVNDAKGNVFTLNDAHQLVRYVHDQGLGGLHFWSLNRDGVCPPGVPALSLSCHGLPGLSHLAFTRAFAAVAR
jgi:hypothetical protein